MIATILNHAGLDPTVVVGGRVATWAAPTRAWATAIFWWWNRDESDGSFLKLAPILAVVTNIDREHLDHYAALDDIRAAFTEFVNKVPFYGAAILCLDDENVQSILPRSAAAPSPTAPARRPICEAGEICCGPFASDFSLRYRADRAGLLPSARSRRA